MSEANKAKVHEFYEQISVGNLNVIETHIADEMVDHDELPGIPANKDGARVFFTRMHSAFADFSMTVEHLVAEGDKVFILGRMKGTHRGEFMGIGATGRPINIPFFDGLRIVNGQAVEHWGVTDTGLMMLQLGVIERSSDQPNLSSRAGADRSAAERSPT